MIVPDLSNFIASIVNSAIILGVAFKGIRALNRLMSILQDYPPHRHVNGRILYPKDFEPTRVETLGDINGRGTT
jgi:hypothetical protein